MKPRLPDSPAKLALLSVLCSLIACATLLIPGSQLNHSWLFSPYLLFCIVVVPVCTILPLKFVTDLRHGVENQRWTEAQLEPLRAHLESRYYTALSVALLVVYFIFEFPETRLRWLGMGLLFFLQIILSQLRFALKRPPSSIPPN